MDLQLGHEQMNQLCAEGVCSVLPAVPQDGLTLVKPMGHGPATRKRANELTLHRGSV